MKIYLKTKKQAKLLTDICKEYEQEFYVALIYQHNYIVNGTNYYGVETLIGKTFDIVGNRNNAAYPLFCQKICEIMNGDIQLEIKIQYLNDKVKKIEKIPQGDWIDLTSAKDYKLNKGDFALIHLGVAMELPKGYEAHVVPRSSTFKNFKVIQTNGIGIIDQTYCGSDDWWFMPVYAVEDTEIHAGDRICQFRLFKNQNEINFIETERLDNQNRGGHGSTGIS